MSSCSFGRVLLSRFVTYSQLNSFVTRRLEGKPSVIQTDFFFVSIQIRFLAKRSEKEVWRKTLVKFFNVNILSLQTYKLRKLQNTVDGTYRPAMNQLGIVLIIPGDGCSIRHLCVVVTRSCADVRESLRLHLTTQHHAVPHDNTTYDDRLRSHSTYCIPLSSLHIYRYFYSGGSTAWYLTRGHSIYIFLVPYPWSFNFFFELLGLRICRWSPIQY